MRTMHIPPHLANLFDAAALTLPIVANIDTGAAMAATRAMGEPMTAAKVAALLGEHSTAAKASVLAWKD